MLRVGRSLQDSTLLERLVRGRGWILLLGTLLFGLVALNVSLLKLNAAAGHSAERAKVLRIQNAKLRGKVSRLASGDRLREPDGSVRRRELDRVARPAVAHGSGRGAGERGHPLGRAPRHVVHRYARGPASDGRTTGSAAGRGSRSAGVDNANQATTAPEAASTDAMMNVVAEPSDW